MLPKILTVSCFGLDCSLVQVEADIARSNSKCIIVGLADTAVQEARERVRAACDNSGWKFPRVKVTVNLAPADLRKEGTAFDLPIALSVLVQKEYFQLQPEDAEALYVGELALSGEVRPVKGILNIAAFASRKKIKRLFVPAENALEASLIPGLEIFSISSLGQLIEHISRKKILSAFQQSVSVTEQSVKEYAVTFDDIRGQEQAKRVLEIAAAGGHNVLFSGPPGSGKTLLAKSFLSILPELNIEESLDVSKIYSYAGLLPSDNPLIRQRPFRSPHHSASLVALVGGGSWPRPGEITLAHQGVLFLDEVAEFPRQVLDALRQPLEEKVVVISRAQANVKFPAQFILLAAANPCPCGYYGYPNIRDCICKPSQLVHYQRKISGPLLDRIDLYLEIVPVEQKKLLARISSPMQSTSAKVCQRIAVARDLQQQRYGNKGGRLNAELSSRQLEQVCELNQECLNLLEQAGEALRLSSRATHKVIKVARTIADLENKPAILPEHILEALQYRKK